MSSDGLVRSLGFRDSLSIVVGSMIGTGIFLKTAVMTQALGSAFWVTVAWFAAGILSLLGALTYAELGAQFPEAGGGYVYVREAYGRLPAFLAGWISVLILYPGSIAAFGVAAGTFVNGVWDVDAKIIAVGLILLFSGLNCLTVSFGGRLQSILTESKILIIAGLAAAIFMLAPQPNSFGAFTAFSSPWSAFGAATLAALWAFDGWEAISRVAGEVRQAQRNIPLSLIVGILLVFALYATLNLAYFWALPVDQIVQSNSTAYPDALPVATKAAASFLGDRGVQILSIVFLISTIGALNGCVLTSARVSFAMAKDQLFFKYLSQVSAKTRVPVRAIWAQALVACLLAVSGSFDQLTNYVIFSTWIFYGITGAAVFVFRKRNTTGPTTFRVPWYPLTPLLFVVMAASLIVATIVDSPRDSAVGIGLILTGLPFYYLFFRKNPKPFAS